MKRQMAFVLMLVIVPLLGCSERDAAAGKTVQSGNQAAKETSPTVMAQETETVSADVAPAPPQAMAHSTPDYSAMTNAELKERADKWDAAAQLAYAKRFADGLENLRQDKSKSDAEVKAEILKVRVEADTMAGMAVVSNPTPEAVRTHGRVMTAIEGRLEPTVAALQVAVELGDSSAENELVRMNMQGIDINVVNIMRQTVARYVARGNRQSAQRTP